MEVKFESSLGYLMSSSPARVTRREPVSKEQDEKGMGQEPF